MSIYTNTGMVAHCRKALQEQWAYGYGAYGQRASELLVSDLINQFPSQNTPWQSYLHATIAKNQRLSDCYGLVKSYFWWVGDQLNPKPNGIGDGSSSSAFQSATAVGTIDQLPEIPGLILHKPGHVGVYIGQNQFIEMMGGGTGATLGTITDGKITKGSKFTHWFKHRNIEYHSSPPLKATEEGAVEVVDTTKIKINGQIYSVQRIFKDDKNYIELQSFTQAGILVSYDEKEKLPILTFPVK